jgi:hypothetical protein
MNQIHWVEVIAAMAFALVVFNVVRAMGVFL